MNTSLAAGPRSLPVDPTDSRLLGALPAADLQRWLPHLEPVSLPAGTLLPRGRQSPGHVYFPTTASISIMHTTCEGDSLEIVAIGNEGLVGLRAIMGGGSALDSAEVRVGGEGYRVRKDWVHSEFHHSAAVMELLLRYTQTLMTHTAQSAVCNTHHSLEQRLCRCLLGTVDRSRDASMNLTHESLSYMLGVRREGVTSVAGKLQRAGEIDYHRGRMTVVDCPALEARSCDCYRVVKAEYDHLLPASASFGPRTHWKSVVPPAAPAPWAHARHLAHPAHPAHPAHLGLHHRTHADAAVMAR